MSQAEQTLESIQSDFDRINLRDGGNLLSPFNSNGLGGGFALRHLKR